MATSEVSCGEEGYLPSSMDMSTLPSGERAMQAMFFRFSKGRVLDLLLGVVDQG
jgi:hypothetical protein